MENIWIQNLKKAHQYHNDENYENAIALFDEVIEIAPSDYLGIVHFAKAGSLVKLKRYREAKTHLEKAEQFGNPEAARHLEMIKILVE